MKKQIVFGIIVLLLFVVLNGCINNSTQKTQMKINSFYIEPNIVKLGEQVRIQWNVTGAMNIDIDNGIGNVNPIGFIVIISSENTTYTLTASNESDTKTVSKNLIIRNKSSENDTDDIDKEKTIAIISTSKGIIKVELFPKKVPNTCNNFIKLANDGFYENLVFHRVIDDFYIQSGGFYSNGTKKISPYGSINLEVTKDLSHVDGAISMSRNYSLNSANSQFFICDGEQTDFDGNYAVFGVVIEGIEVLRDIASVSTTTKYEMDYWPINDIIIYNITIENE